MKKVNQTKFGGIDGPFEEYGNCFQAAVASIFELPLEEAFDCRPYYHDDQHYIGKPVDQAPFFIAFREWLNRRGFDCIFLQVDQVQPMITEMKGYHLAETKSTTLFNGEHHIVVMKDGGFVHDPNPNAENYGDLVGIYFIVPRDPVKFSIVST